MRATGMLLKVLSMLALTPGGGSNTKIRPARSRFTGTWQENTLRRLWGVKEKRNFGARPSVTVVFIIKIMTYWKYFLKWCGLPWGWSPLSRKAWSWHEAAWSGASFPAASAIQGPGGHSPTSPTCRTKTFRITVQPNKVYMLRKYTFKKHYPPARLDSSVDVFVCFIEALSWTCEQYTNTNIYQQYPH